MQYENLTFVNDRISGLFVEIQLFVEFLNSEILSDINHTGFIKVIHKVRGVSPVIFVAQNMNANIRGVSPDIFDLKVNRNNRYQD